MVLLGGALKVCVGYEGGALITRFNAITEKTSQSFLVPSAM